MNGTSQATDPVDSSLTVQGSAWVLRVADGRVLRGPALSGAIVHVAVDGGRVAPLRIASVTPDPQPPHVLRHPFETRDGRGGWNSACPPNAAGETWGLPLTLLLGHPGRDRARQRRRSGHPEARQGRRPRLRLRSGRVGAGRGVRRPSARVRRDHAGTPSGAVSATRRDPAP